MGMVVGIIRFSALACNFEGDTWFLIQSSTRKGYYLCFWNSLEEADQNSKSDGELWKTLSREVVSLRDNSRSCAWTTYGRDRQGAVAMEQEVERSGWDLAGVRKETC